MAPCTWMSVPERTIERDEVVVDTGLTYTEGEPVLVRIRRRGGRFELRDDGRADLNVTRTGVVFVPAVEGGVNRDCLAGRVAETSLALYGLLELE